MNFQHIILVSLDTLRADCIKEISSDDFLKRFSPRNYSTQSLDWLIRNGTFFARTISAAPYTTASHAAYFTGCWPKNNRVYEFYNRKLAKPTIFEMSKKNERTTIFQTDFPIILGQNIGFTKGVDHYYVENESQAFNTLLSHKKRKTLSFFHFGGIHYPYGFHKTKFAKNDYMYKVKTLEKKFSLDEKISPTIFWMKVIVRLKNENYYCATKISSIIFIVQRIMTNCTDCMLRG